VRRGAQTAGAMSVWWLNFLQFRIMFVDLHRGTGLMLQFWRLEYWGDPRLLKILCTPGREFYSKGTLRRKRRTLRPWCRAYPGRIHSHTGNAENIKIPCYID
jgi:hypothetical protein